MTRWRGWLPTRWINRTSRLERQAIDLGRAILEVAGRDYPGYADLLEDVSLVLSARRPIEALPLCREAVACTPESDPDMLARRLITLGNVLYRLRQSTGQPVNSEETAVFARAAILVGPASEYASHAIGGLLRALEEAPRPEDAVEAAELLRGVRAAGHGGLDDWLAGCLIAAGASNFMRYEDGHVGIESMREAAAMVDEAAGLTHNPYTRIMCRQAQARAIGTVHEKIGEAAALESNIACYREVVASPHVRDADRAQAMAWLADRLFERYRRDGGQADLEEAVAVWDEAMAAPALPAPTRAWAALPRREAQECHTAPRPDTAIPLHLVVVSAVDDSTTLTAYDPATAGAPGDDEAAVPAAGPCSSPAALVALARVEFVRCARRADPAGAASAIEAARDAVLATPLGDPNLPRLLVMLGDAYRLHLTRTQDATKLSEAARIYRWAAVDLPAADPRKAETLYKAANVFTQCAVTFDRPAAAAEALELRRACVAAARDDDPNRHAYDSILVKALAWAATGVMPETDLSRDQTITAWRAAVDAAPKGSPEWSLVSGYLDGALSDRYDDAGDRGDLDESIEILRGAAEFATGKAKAEPLLHLAARLRERYATSHDVADMIDAMMAARQAHAADSDRVLTTEQLLGLPGYLMPSDMEEPVGIGEVREALRSAQPGYSEEAVHQLCSLANSMFLRGARGEARPADVEQALEVTRRLLEIIPSGSIVHLSSHHVGLAGLLRLRFEQSGDPRDRDEAYAVARRTYASPGGATARIGAARLAAQWAAEDGCWTEAAEDLRQAVKLLPALAPRQIRREDQERRLSTVFGLASRAAETALQCGDAEGALEALEQGRNLLRRYVTESRSDFGELGVAAPELARELRLVADELDAAAEVGHGAPEISADHRHHLAQRWDAAVLRARSLPGFERFLCPPRAAELLDGPGTIVVLNVGGHRCDALLIQEGRLDVIRLPDLNADELNRQVTLFTDTIPFVQLNPDDAESQRLAEQPLRQVLSWLWDVVAWPVLDHLDLTHPPQSGGSPPKIWWLPTGSLTLLPIHAAGPSSGAAVSDLVVSSYALSVRDLRAAQSAAARHRRPNPGRLLAVAMTHTPNQRPLARAADEIAAVIRHFADSVVLSGDEATYGRVNEELPGASWAHFACHAASYPHRPSESRLLLADQALTVAALARQQLPDAHLAYLSACETARGGTYLADEGITLASAFRLAGYTHAVAALWPVLDSTAAETAKVFYREAVIGGAEPAVALHRAQLAIRSKYPDLPSRWAAYLHAGP